MALAKYAAFEVLSAHLERNTLARTAARDVVFNRTAHRHAFQYDPKPGFLYVRSRAISSRCNDNFDDFPADEIKQSYLSFVGKPVFVNHNNENHRRARGVCIAAALHEDTNPDGSPDTWVEVLMEVDAIHFPKLAEAILKGHIDRTSMGTDVAYSICSFCGNKATTPLEYCAHIPKLKGKRIRRTTASGEKQDILVREICHGLKFFENSLLVEDPADPTAFFLGVDASQVEAGLQATAVGRDSRPSQYATSLANGEKLRLGHCKYCNSQIAWAKSKAGKWYPCEVRSKVDMEYGLDHNVKRAAPWEPHRCQRDMEEDEGWGGGRTEPHADLLLTESLQTMSRMSLQKAASLLAEADATDMSGTVDTTGTGSACPASNTVHPSGVTNTEHHCPACGWPVWVGYRGYIEPHEPVRHRKKKKKRPGQWIDGYHASLEVTATRAFITAKLDYTTPSGGSFRNQRRFHITWNTSPDPKDWGGPVYLDQEEWDPEAATALVEANGVRVTSDWEWVPLPGIYRAEGQWDRTASLIRASALIEEAKRMDAVAAIEDVYRRHPMHTEAYGEVVAPPKVDTLRDSICPVCGEEESFDGDKCMVCGYMKPPDQFMDPDLDKARNVDLRQENGDNMVPAQETPAVAGGQLECDNCGSAYDGVADADPLNKDTGDEYGSTPDNNFGQDPVERKTDPNNAAKPDPDPDKDPAKMPRLPKPEKSPDAADVEDAAKPDKGEKQPTDTKTKPKAGDDCPNCGKGKLQPKGDAKGGGDAFVPPTGDDEKQDDQQDKDEAEDADDKDGEGKKKPPWMKDKKSSALSRAANLLRSVEADEQKENSMRPALAALVEQQKVLVAQERQITGLRGAVAFIAEAAGLNEHPTVVAALADDESLFTTADANNPAQPIPDPPAEAPEETTDQALAPAGKDSPESVGESPVNSTAPAATTSVDAVGGTVADEALDLNEHDVTKPVAGTEGPRPLNEVKIETEQRIGPWQGNDPNPAFPLQGPFAERARTTGAEEPEPQAVMQSEGRTIASLRLARLRIQAGIADTADDLTLGSTISMDEDVSDEAIQTEIDTLSKVLQTSAAAQQRQPVSRNLVPQARTASVNRTVPSIASDEVTIPMQTVASGPTEDEFLFE